MPTYEYRCDNCQHQFDEFQSMKDEPLTTCPKCGQPKLRRLFGAGAAIIFKGSGFYQTDYRSESYKAAAKADQAPSGKASDGGKNGSTSDSSSTKSDTSSAKPAGGSTPT